MKVAIAVYTQTGHSATVARSAATKLREKGHEADVLLIKARGELSPATRKVDFESVPDVTAYEAIVVGGPVWAFRASAPILQGVLAMEGLKGKKAIAFVTHGLPFMFTGPRRALAALAKALGRRGAIPADGVTVWCWKKPDQARIEQAAGLIAERIAAA